MRIKKGLIAIIKLLVLKRRDIMKKTEVKICVCTGCIMSGAIDIMNGAENLRKLAGTAKNSVKIYPAYLIGDSVHDTNSPVVMINDELIENANSQTVMAKILSLHNQNDTKEERD